MLQMQYSYIIFSFEKCEYKLAKYEHPTNSGPKVRLCFYTVNHNIRFSRFLV